MIAILCTVTGYEATSPEANIDLQVDEKNPHVPERVTAQTLVLDMTHSSPMMEQKLIPKLS